MESETKRRHNDIGVDRISGLPENIMDLILQCLPVRDAARTSFLSRIWRNIWGTHPQLIFDNEFIADIVSKYDKKAQLSEVSKTISSILLVHNGPILKFHLSIPEDLPLHQCRDMYLWIKNISNNGVRELELSNKALKRYNMPSYLFSCVELTHLKLTECVLNPPLGFGGFCNLISVKLKGVTITADLSFGAQLEELDLERCNGIEHLGCQFKCNNNLTTLVIIRSGEIDWRWFECTHKVQVLCLMCREVEVFFNKKVINFGQLVGNMHGISMLSVDGHFLQLLEPGAANSQKLTTSIENLKRLSLSQIEIYNLHQIQYVLCLIRSSPNLQTLRIQLKNSWDNMKSVAAVEHYLQLPNFAGMILDQLETVEIEGMVGSRAELHLIKNLLASTPSLKWMKLKYKTTHVDPEEEVKILRGLLPLARASTSAEIIWN